MANAARAEDKPATQPAPDAIAILPAKVELSGPAARQSLLVEQLRANQFVGPVQGSTEFTSADPNVVKIEAGAAIPVHNGQTTLTVRAGNQTAAAHVTVTGLDHPFDWSFRNHVQPVLAKAGCSSGACHGAAAGKSGFKLSLRGFDDDGDWLAITRDALGRRIIPSDPSASLFVLKPLNVVPHKGGVRFTPDSQEFRVLGEWIAAGAPGPKSDDPRIARIEILPPAAVLKPGDKQPLIVLAHFSDGTVQDVTRWAKYTAAEASVAIVDDATGRVSVVGNGEGAITAWYLSKIAIATIASPYPNSLPPDTFAQAPRRNLIDDRVLEKLASLNLPPSPPAQDAEFLRRVYLDTLGVLPTVDEVRKFATDGSPDKRDRLIESLFARSEFVDYWAYKWSDLLLVSSRRLQPHPMWSYYHWVRNQVALNTPWDQFARQLVTATGNTLDNGAANFYVLHDDPKEMSETLSVAMLGMSINCAKCHNHPLEKWTNDQYFGMANLLARVRTKSGGADGAKVVFTAEDGDVIQPLRGKPQKPCALDGAPIGMEDPRDRREVLADWLVSRDNPYFSRAIVNRVWANFMGVGLVEKVDDMRKTNPPSNEKLLAALADYLADQKFDLRALMRLILQSQTYQRSSQPLPGNVADRRFYSHYYPRRLMAEVLLDGLSQVTAVPTPFQKEPAGWRAMQLPDSNVESYFLTSFGRPERTSTCTCERTIEPSMTQVLHIANGDTINQKLQSPKSKVGQWLDAKATDEQIIQELYLSSLSREPSPDERSRLLAILATTKTEERRQALEDLCWGVLSSNEFLFNH